MSFDNIRGVHMIGQEGAFSHEMYVLKGGEGPDLKWGDGIFTDASNYLIHIQGMTKPSDEFEIEDVDGIIELTVRSRGSSSVSKAFRFLVDGEHREELMNALRELKGTGERLLISY